MARATFRLALGIYDAFVAYFDENAIRTLRFDVCIDGQRVDALGGLSTQATSPTRGAELG